MFGLPKRVLSFIHYSGCRNLVSASLARHGEEIGFSVTRIMDFSKTFGMPNKRSLPLACTGGEIGFPAPERPDSGTIELNPRYQTSHLIADPDTNI